METHRKMDHYWARIVQPNNTMKSSSLPLTRVLGAISLLFIGLTALPQEARADRHRGSTYRGSSYNQSSRYHSGYGGRASSSYRPSSSFSFSFGSGYNYGRPYYGRPSYGPSYNYGPSYPVYSNRSVYSARDQNASVQSALARRGYYRGSIDGVIGSQSRRAIANYQQDRGLRATGTITQDLLRSLGI